MSRQATQEYINARRRKYCAASGATKRRMIDEAVDTTGLSRKYVINLLNGKVRYRARPGRGKTYGGEISEVLAAVWREAGCPCSTYFKAEIARWVEVYTTHVAVIGEADKALILKMSDTTMGRLLKGRERVKPGWSKANKRSGRGVCNEIKANTPCASGESVMASQVPPGDAQVDTFALGGGDPSDNFFWILNTADRRTQWTELSPTWNRAQHATLVALRHNEARMPFPILSYHPDNGGEIMNHHVLAYLAQRENRPFVYRSRPRKCNDNAHVEEKNRSVGRQLFGEVRLDCPELEKPLFEICELWSDFKNFFCPCKMLIAKEKREDGKGYRCRYDKPKTPYQRVLEANVLAPEQRAALEKRRNALNGIELYHKIVKKLKKIKRMQADHVADKFNPNRAPHRPKHDFKRIAGEKKASLEFLASQKPPQYLEGVRDIAAGMKRIKKQAARN